MNKIVLFVITLFFLCSFPGYSQDDGGVKIMPKQGDLYENVKTLQNPYSLPLWGKKLGKKGFLLPYPIGVMINGYATTQDVTISDLSVGVNDGAMQSLDNLITFGKVSANVQNMNVRTDVWVLPFLDVYAMYGKSWAQTKVGIAEIMNKPVGFNTEADFNGYTYGLGAMLTGGIRSIFFSLDASKIWTHFDEMENNNSAVNMGLRTGYIFHFEGKPEKNISVWTGATRLFLSSTTEGSINLSEIMPDIGGDYQNSDWYQALGPAKKIFVDDLVEKAGDRNNTIHYSLKKRPAKNWAMVLGTQFQLNRHWQFRVETNFLGGRKSGLVSANYRFGILDHNKHK